MRTFGDIHVGKLVLGLYMTFVLAGETSAQNKGIRFLAEPAFHDELHHYYLENVPRPPEDVMKKAWAEYCANRAEIDQYDLCRAIAWLYVHVEDAQFRKAMQIQLDFFTLKLGPE